MSSILNAFLLTTLVAITSVHGIITLHVEPSAASNVSSPIDSFKVCIVGETYCSDGCDQLLLCLANQETLILEDCSQTQLTCDSRTSKCLPPEESSCEPQVPGSEFLCHAPGLFPDPFDCHAYHICPEAGVLGIRYMCPAVPYGYDPLSGRCRYSAEDRVCVEGPVPRCLAQAQTGPQKENPNIYYVCVSDPDKEGAFVPWLFRCRVDSEVFDDDVKQCVTPVPTTTPRTGGATQKQPGCMWLLLMITFTQYTILTRTKCKRL